MKLDFVKIVKGNATVLMKKNPPVDLSSSVNYYKYYLFFIVLVLLVFGNTIGNDYNMDDNLVTQSHSFTSKKEISTIKNIFTSPYYEDDMGYSYGYRPVVLLSFFIEHSIFKESARVSHLFNLLLYTLTVVLLFKLLVSWWGEKGLILAFLTVALFTIHPLHAEGVASIKNRDEILSFLFAILAGLAIEKYLGKKKWYLLFVIASLFVLGMLSKKSVYPLVVILPIAFVLFKNIGLKHLAFISMALIIPGAIIGSKLDIGKFFLLFFLASSGVFSVYILKIMSQANITIKKLYTIIRLYDIHLLSALSWFFVAISIFGNNFGLFLLSILCLLFILKRNEYMGIIQLVLQLLLIGFYFENLYYLVQISSIISTGYLMYNLSNKKKDLLLLVLTILTYLILIYSFFSSISFTTVLAIIIFFYFLNKNIIWALLFSLLMISVSLFFFETNLMQINFLAFSIICFINLKKKSYSFTFYSSSVLLILNILFIASQTTAFFNISSSTSKMIKVQKNRNLDTKNSIYTPVSSRVFNENRPVGYVENTLMADHSKSETIGTGFIVIGEYLKLMLFPKELSFYYGYSKIKTTGLNDLSVWLSIITHLGLLLLAIWQFNKRPIISFGVVWYGLSIVLFSNWPEMVAGMVGERLAFTASAGFSIFIAGIIMWIKPNFSFVKPKGVELIVFAMLIVLAGRTFSRNAEWKDPLTLMGNDIEHLENSAQANNLYATYLMKESVQRTTTPQAKHNYQVKALKHFEKAVSIYPQFFNANYDIGRVCIELRDFQGAKNAFEKAYQIKPENLLVLEELCKTSFDLKLKEDTESYGNLYLDKNPNNENLHELVAYTMLINKEPIKAKEYAERGLRYYPANKNLQGILFESSK